MFCHSEVIRLSDSKHLELLVAHNSWNRWCVQMLSPSFGISEGDFTGISTVEFPDKLTAI